MSIRRRLAAIRARRGDDGGSVLVEFALVLPVISLLVLGILDFGMAWNESNLVERAVSVAARTGSGKGIAPEADQDVVLSLASSFTSMRYTELEKIIVFDSDTADGEVPSDCLDAAPGVGVDGVCNVYDAAMAEAGTGFSFEGNECSGTLDAAWCPTSRDAEPPDRDYLGVYVEATYSSLTSLLPTSFTIERQAVYLIEPTSVAGGG